MSRLTTAVEDLHRDERDLAGELLRLSQRHVTDHGVHHVSQDLARWSRRHVADLARVGRDLGLDLDPGVDDPGALGSRVRQVASVLTGRQHAPAAELVHDLRALYARAAAVSLDWDVLAQSAQALRLADLLAVAESCRPETVRQMRWAEAQVKEVSAQAMVTP